MLAKSMVANALDKSKEKKFDILENSDIVDIAKGANSSWNEYWVKNSFLVNMNIWPYLSIEIYLFLSKFKLIINKYINCVSAVNCHHSKSI